MDSDSTPMTKPIISMIQNYIPVSVKVQSFSDMDTCAANDTNGCWTVEFSHIPSGYERLYVNECHNFKVKCEVMEENWLDEENSDSGCSFCDYSTKRLEWW